MRLVEIKFPESNFEGRRKDTQIKQFIYPTITDAYLFRELYPLKDETLDRSDTQEWKDYVKSKLKL
jgi:hypothetical protein